MRELRAGKVAIYFIFIFFVAANGFCAGADSEGWMLLQDGLYINSKSISKSDDGKRSLWVKIVPEEGSNLMLDARTHLMEDGKEYQALKYDFTALLSEIDCFRKRHRELINIMYDVNNNIVHSLETSPASWKEIPSESSLDLVLPAFCY